MAKKFPLYVPLIGRDNLTPTLQKATKGMTALGNHVAGIGRKMTAGLTLPTLAAGSAVFRTGANFEREMNRVRALSGATGQDLKDLRDQAQELGSTTVHSASQAAAAQALLAQAGFKTHENLATLPSVMNLASAGAIELSDSTSTLADVLRGYNLQATQSSRVADVLSTAQASANTTILELGEAFKMAGPLAAGAGIEFEETAAMLSLIADKGFKASMGGTAVRNMLLKLGKPSAEAKKALAELGIQRDSILNADGTVKSWRGLIAEFESAEATIPQLNAIFGERAVGPFQAMLSAGSGQLEVMHQKMLESSGSAQRTAKTMMDGVAGSTARFRSALEGFALKLGESGFLDQVAAGIGVVTDFVSNLAASDPELLRVGTTVALVAAAVGPLIGVIGMGISVVSSLTVAAGGLWNIMKVGFVLMKAHPLGLVITAAFALQVAIHKISEKWNSSLSIWENVKSIVGDLASNAFGLLLGALKKIAQWALPGWAEKLLGLSGSEIKVSGTVPQGGGPSIADDTGPGRGIGPGAPGPGGAGGQASVALTIKSDKPGAYSLDSFDAGGTDLTIDQGVALGTVTG